MESTVTTDINVADTVWNVLNAWSSSERGFYIAAAVIVSLVSIALAIYAINTIHRIQQENVQALQSIEKDFTAAISEQRKDFLQHLR